MNNQLCEDNIICCDDNCQRCANLIYNKYLELQEENKKLKQEYEPVRHGEWIECGKDDNDMTIVQCSICQIKRYGAPAYCSRCGTKMDGGSK